MFTYSNCALLTRFKYEYTFLLIPSIKLALIKQQMKSLVLLLNRKP